MSEVLLCSQTVDVSRSSKKKSCLGRLVDRYSPIEIAFPVTGICRHNYPRLHMTSIIYATWNKLSKILVNEHFEWSPASCLLILRCWDFVQNPPIFNQASAVTRLCFENGGIKSRCGSACPPTVLVAGRFQPQCRLRGHLLCQRGPLPAGVWTGPLFFPTPPVRFVFAKSHNSAKL